MWIILWKMYSFTKNIRREGCDVILGVDSEISECHIVPVHDILQREKSVNIKYLEEYKENWNIFR